MMTDVTITDAGAPGVCAPASQYTPTDNVYHMSTAVCCRVQLKGDVFQ